MYDLNKYPEILALLKSISFIYKNQANGWIQILCPYCNDANRKGGSISHGHFYISTSFNYCQCFRCEYSSSFTKFLADANYENIQVIKELSSQSGNFTYSNIKNRTILIEDVKNHLTAEYEKHQRILKDFLKYVYSRCFNINPINFLLCPGVIDNNTVCTFYNYNGLIISSRLLHTVTSMRYIKPNHTDYYFFQDINHITNYNNIVICEGGFDLINLFEYSPYFDKNSSFYIAINGRDYTKIIRNLLADYLLLGKYTINIVFDTGVLNINKIKNINKFISNQLNPNITFKYFQPSISKDVSEIMSISSILN